MSEATVTYRMHAQLLIHADAPLIRIDRSAYLPCGCSVHVGALRDDPEQHATGVVPCQDPGHAGLVEDCMRRLRATGPTRRHTIEVAARALTRASERSTP